MATAKKTKSGNFRCLVYDYTDINGKRKYKSFTASTKREAELMAAEYLNGRTKKSKNDITLGVAIDSYIEERTNILSPPSLKTYKTLSKKYEIYRDFKLVKFDGDFLQKYVNELAQEYSAKYVSNIYGFISTVIQHYDTSITLSVTLPSKKKYKRYIPTQEEINSLYQAVKDTEMELPILLASMGMLRRSEICALTKDDFTGNRIHINKAMVITPEYTWTTKAPKTYAGDRYVNVLPYITELFMALPGDSIGLNPDNITDRFGRLRERLGLPYFRFHDLRASGASIRHALGVPDLYVMSDAGWTNDKMLKEIYGATMSDFGTEYDNKVSDFYNRMLTTDTDYSELHKALEYAMTFLDDENYLEWLGDREKSLDTLHEFTNMQLFMQLKK